MGGGKNELVYSIHFFCLLYHIYLTLSCIQNNSPNSVQTLITEGSHDHLAPYDKVWNLVYSSRNPFFVSS